MAQKVHIILEDDLDGSEATETITYALDGKAYEIDLNEKNAKKLRTVLGPFVEKGRRVTGSRSSRSSRGGGSGSDAAVVREWAKGQGLDVPSRGRIPAEVRNAYDAAH